MGWLNIARVAKVLAFAGFLMPWLVVSCQEQEMASATGIDLAMGRMQAVGDSGAAQSTDPVWWAVAVLLLIVAGLIGSFLVKGRGAALLTAATAAGALALAVWGMTETVGDVRTRAAAEAGGGDAQLAALQAQVADAIRIEVRYGYWITLLGLAGATAAGVMAASGRRGPRQTVPVDSSPDPAP